MSGFFFLFLFSKGFRFVIHLHDSFFQVQRGSQSSEKECSTVINNEIPVQLETAHLGLGGNNRGNRILPGTTGGIPPGGDPGGWVSLAALSRTQVSNRINNAYNGGSGITPQHFNPVLRLPPIGVRRPVDSSVYDSGFQYNTVSVPNRPFLSSIVKIYIY